MTIVPSRPTVGTSPVLIAENALGAGRPDAGTRAFWLTNETATAVIYLGGDTVTAATGKPWDVSRLSDLFLELEPGEQLWGVVASGQPTQTVSSMRGGR